MRIINVLSRRTISEIKLKRTDTTLDLSQKAKLFNMLARFQTGRGSASLLTELLRKKKEGRKTTGAITGFDCERKSIYASGLASGDFGCYFLVSLS